MNYLLVIGLLLGASPVWAATLTVCASGCTYNNSQFQNALTAAALGDTITLEAGVSYVGPYNLPLKSGTTYLTIRSSNTANVPADGVRTDPSYAAYLPKIMGGASNDRAFTVAAGAHHYKFQNVEIASDWTQDYPEYNMLLQFGAVADVDAATTAELPHHIILDRVYCHGTASGSVHRCVVLNTGDAQVINSYITDFHMSDGRQAACISIYNGTGPFLIQNNWLECAGENILFGGADPGISGLIPSDITITQNTFTRKLAWYTNSASVGGPAYDGNGFAACNHLEFKNAQRVTVTGNLFQYSWSGCGQHAQSINIASVNQSGGCTWCVAKQITVRDNIIKHVGEGISICGECQFVTAKATDIVIDNNLIYDIDETKWLGTGYAFQLLGVPQNVSITHNTTDAAYHGMLQISVSGSTTGVAHNGFVFRDNIVRYGLYGFRSDSYNGWTDNAANGYFPSGVFSYNAIVYDGSLGPYFPIPPSIVVPVTTFEGATTFENYATADYRVKSGSVLYHAGSDGTDIGVNIAALAGAGTSAYNGVGTPAGGGRRPAMGLRVR